MCPARDRKCFSVRELLKDKLSTSPISLGILRYVRAVEFIAKALPPTFYEEPASPMTGNSATHPQGVPRSRTLGSDKSKAKSGLLLHTGCVELCKSYVCFFIYKTGIFQRTDAMIEWKEVHKTFRGVWPRVSTHRVTKGMLPEGGSHGPQVTIKYLKHG